MKKTLAILLTALLSVPLVGASNGDTHADCEDGQPGIGWNPELITPDSNQHVCEGEHWDGQDYYFQNDPNTNGGGALPCTGASTTGGASVAVLNCADPDASPTGIGAPVGVRVSVANGATTYVYTGVQIYQLGVANTAVETGGGTTIAGVYLKDHSIGNVLATAVSAPRITKGYVDDSDCTQDQYADAAFSGDAERCKRDNTAITVALTP